MITRILCAWRSSNSGDKAHPVGQKKANELGLYDMSGNAIEWCSDWYGNYSAEAQSNPKGAKEGKWRVCRGGSWYYDNCRVGGRDYVNPDYQNAYIGFRLAQGR